METEHFDDEVIALCERRALPPRRMLAVLAIFAGYAEEAVHQLIQTVAATPYVAPAEPEPAPIPDTGGRGQRECVACGEVKGHTAFNVGSTTCRKCNGKT